jgi:hypothetical protein
MDWKTFWILFAKAALRVLADELDPANRRRGPYEDAPPKQAPTPPRAEASAPGTKTSTPPRAEASAPPRAEASAAYAAPQSAESAGWGVQSEPPPVTVLRIETDQGSVVSPVSFIGEEHWAPERVQRARQPGESRRVRRKAPMPTTLPRSPEMTAAVARMRARASGAAPVVSQPAAAPPRRPGTPRTITGLTSTTLRLLASGEPLKDAASAA